MQIAKAFVQYVADTKELEKALGPTGAVAAAGTKSATSVGDRFKTAASRSAVAFGAAGGVMFTSALEGATKLEDQMRTVNTVAGLSDQELAGLTDSVQALSRETGASTDDLTAGLYDLVSAGVPASKAIDVLRDSAKLGIGALGSTASSVDAVTSALNAYGLGAEESGRVTDVLAKAVQDGKVTIDEIGGSIANIAPIAASAGISLEEVSAGYAALTAKGVPAAQAATQMRAAISALLTPNAELNKIQKETGINFAELAKTKGLAVALEELRKATGGNAEQFGKALGSVEAYQFALATTGENAEAFAGQITETLGAAGIAQSQYDEKSRSAAEQGKRLFATLNTFAQDVGGPFVGGLGQGVFALNQLGSAMMLPISPAKILGGAIGGVATKSGGLVKALGKGVTGKLIPTFLAGLGGIIPAATPILGTIGAAIPTIIAAAMTLWPVILVGAIVAGIVFLANNPEIVAKIGEFVTGLLDALSGFLEVLPDLFFQAFDAALAMVGEVLAKLPEILAALIPMIAEVVFRIPQIFLQLHLKIAEIFVGLGARIVAFFLELPAKIGPFVGGVVAKFVELAGQIPGVVAGFVGAVVRQILTIPGRIAGLLGSVGGLFRSIAATVAGIVSGLAAKAVAFVLSIPGRIIGLLGTLATFFTTISTRLAATISSLVGKIVGFFMGIPGRIASLGGKIVSGIINGMASFPGKLANVIGNAFRNLRIDIGPFHISGSGVTIDLPKIEMPSIGLPSFDVGARYVPDDMIAMVHRGEMIIRRDEASAIRSGRMSIGDSMRTPTLAAAMEGVGGGGPTTIHIPFAGALPVREPADLVYEMQRLETDGIIPPKRRPPMYDRRWVEKK